MINDLPDHTKAAILGKQIDKKEVRDILKSEATNTI